MRMEVVRNEDEGGAGMTMALGGTRMGMVLDENGCGAG